MKKRDVGGSSQPDLKAEVRGEATPGPWHYQENSDAYTHIVRDSADRYICGCSQDSGGNAERNARLIAAAPELLEACRAVKEYLGSLGRNNPDDPLLVLRKKFHGPLLAKLDPAIAKATGTRTTHPNPADQPNSTTKETK
jgi:hypothetical protein